MANRNYRQREDETTSKNGRPTKGRNNSKKNRSNYKRNDRGTKGESRDDKSSNTMYPMHNDATWYFADSTLMDQASRYSFNQFVGQNVKLGSTVSEVQSDFYVKNPSMCVIEMIPTPNQARHDANGDPQTTSGLNLVARKFYSQLSSVTGRTANYTPADISLMLLAMGELLSCVSYIRRAFNVLYIYNMRNRDYPLCLLRAMNIDDEDFIANISNYRTKANIVINTINKLPIPASIAYLAKCSQMYDNVYLDMDSPMAQTIFMVPATTWRLDEEVGEYGSTLVTTVFARRSYTGSSTESHPTMLEYLDNLMEMAEALLTSTTLNVVYADMLNYASKASLPFVSIPLIVEGVPFTPIYDPSFRLQFHNLQCINEPNYEAARHKNAFSGLAGKYAVTDLNNVTCAKNLVDISYCPVHVITDSIYGTAIPNSEVLANMTNYRKNLIVDYDVPEPSVEMRVDSTRYIAFPDEYFASTDATKGVMAYTFRGGDHSATAIWVNNYNNTKLNTSGIVRNNMLSITSNSDVRAFGTLSCFYPKIDWFPNTLVTYWGFTSNKIDPSTMELLGTIGDLNYYTTIDQNYLNNVNTLSEQGLFELRTGK